MDVELTSKVNGYHHPKPKPRSVFEEHHGKSNERAEKRTTTDENESEIPEPPDGGWGWLIVLASFLCNTLVDGVSYSFGILLIEFMNYYKSQKGETAWIGSLLTGVLFSSGFVVGPLTNKFGCRPVTMAGSVVAAFAFLVSAVAPNVRVLYFTYGILGGFGFGMIYLPGIVSVGYYFSTKRALATCIATCGAGMGAFVFAPLTQKLLETYDWKGALVIIAGLSLNCMVFGSIMRPLELKMRKHKEIDTNECDFQNDGLLENNKEPYMQPPLSIQAIATHDYCDTHFDFETVRENNGVIHFQGNEYQRKSAVNDSTRNNPEKSLFPTSQKTNATMSTCQSQINMKDYFQNLSGINLGSVNILYPTPFSEGYVIQKSYRWRKSTNPEVLVKPNHRKDIFYSGNISHLPELKQSRHDVRSYVANVTSLPDGQTSSPKCTVKGNHNEFSVISFIADALKNNLDFSLFRNFSFCMACLGNVFGLAGYFIMWVYLTDISIHKGIPEDHASLFLSIMGITNMVGKIIFGFIVDCPNIRSMDMYNMCLVVSAFAAVSIPFCFSYTANVIATSIFGAFGGAYISLISIILVDMVGLDKLTSSFGIVNLFRGIGSVIGPPIAGTVFDYTGSYDIPFYMAGGFLLISGIFTLISPSLSLCKKTAIEQERNAVKASEEVQKQSKVLLA